MPGQEQFEVVVIGGGQAGLATGYHLARRGLRFVILDASQRVGDAWRNRWTRLRVFTRARYDGLPGMRFPSPPGSFPTKDQVADFLEDYARRKDLPVRSGVRVDSLAQIDGGRFAIMAGSRGIEADQVVVASGAFHEPRVPDFRGDLSPEIRQLHSVEYRNPAQLQPGGVLVVGAGNSGAEIAFDAAPEHRTWLSGRDTGQMPFPIDGAVSRLVDPLIWFLANHVLTVDTWIGRRAGPSMRTHGVPLERVRLVDLREAGVTRVYARTVGARDGLPLLDDGSVVDVSNVVWCTGFRHDFAWIEFPILGEDGWPMQDHGVVDSVPGLYFVGLPFMRAIASALIGGVGRDAAHVVERIAARQAAL
ncbi:MAG TPA: FAD-dependent oxidoreductase [Candidatus Limnocylindrales bacterium]|nr:FAD-dependent oxidoreductase [Candidatus Limnocylindrales bacterium]